MIVSLIRDLFNNFTGAEVYNSSNSNAIKARIERLDTGLERRTNDLIKYSLYETLRDYQILNNSFVRGRPDLMVKLKNASEGFVIEKVNQKPAKVLLPEHLTNQHYLIRIEKPEGLVVEAGMAMALTVKTKSGLETRVLSISNSPNEKYIEFAVGKSESSFKKQFIELKEGDHVYVEKLKNQLPFATDKPAVMIAGGIGITPFRSMIQYAKDTNLQNPMWLFYGNRSEIPFREEIDSMATKMSNFNVIHTLSNPSADWSGRKGRVDDKFLDEVVPTIPKDAIYYIVGSPDMILGTKNNLLRLGIPEEQIKIEAFGGMSKKTESKEKSKEEKKDEETICFCHNVSKGVIDDIISLGGDMKQIQPQTNAGTGCGACKCKIGSTLKCGK